ncbi:hypothetical protein G9A89_017634 [Geosiphon pyriformis]|nr:hypothetical protein G9A89_017634 [Geosiphon pyriformis]
MPEEQDFYHTALLEARIAENANLSDIFFFEFEANESLFLLSNAAANKQKAITAMYTEAEVEGKAICLILDSGSTGSIITYQLMQQLKKMLTDQLRHQSSYNERAPVLNSSNAKLDWETQELQLFYQGQHAQVPATCGTFNKQSEKAPVFEFEEEEEKPVIETFMVLESTSNWAEETEQTYFATKLYPEEPEIPE